MYTLLVHVYNKSACQLPVWWLGVQAADADYILQAKTWPEAKQQENSLFLVCMDLPYFWSQMFNSRTQQKSFVLNYLNPL